MTQTDPGRARSLIEQARKTEQLGDATRALQLYDDALSLLEDETDLPLLADALRWKGTLHREQGETELAHHCYKQSLVHAEECGSLNCRAHAYNCLAIVAQRRGSLTESERLYAQASELAAKAGDVRLLGMIEQNLGVATALATRQLIMVAGSIATETTADVLSGDPELQRRYLGVEPLAK